MLPRHADREKSLSGPRRKPIVGVMGPGAGAAPELTDTAEELGREIARAGWITLSGGRNAGVMDAVSRGAKDGGGLTVGIMPAAGREGISAYVDIPIITGMGSARNNINVLTSDVIIACGLGRGTAAEVALALKAGKEVILLGASPGAVSFFREIGGPLVTVAASPRAAVRACKKILRESPEGDRVAPGKWRNTPQEK